MTERSRRIMYRLYGLAEVVYWDSWNRNWKKDRSEIEKLSIVVNEEPEDNYGDEWTMFEKDYKIIREVMEVYDDNTDWATIKISEDNPFVSIVEVEE